MYGLDIILHVTANIRSAQSNPGVGKLWPKVKNEPTDTCFCMEQSHTPSFIYCLWPFGTVTELRRGNRDHIA